MCRINLHISTEISTLMSNEHNIQNKIVCLNKYFGKREIEIMVSTNIEFNKNKVLLFEELDFVNMSNGSKNTATAKQVNVTIKCMIYLSKHLSIHWSIKQVNILHYAFNSNIIAKWEVFGRIVSIHTLCWVNLFDMSNCVAEGQVWSSLAIPFTRSYDNN